MIVVGVRKKDGLLDCERRIRCNNTTKCIYSTAGLEHQGVLLLDSRILLALPRGYFQQADVLLVEEALAHYVSPFSVHRVLFLAEVNIDATQRFRGQVLCR